MTEQATLLSEEEHAELLVSIGLTRGVTAITTGRQNGRNGDIASAVGHILDESPRMLDTIDILRSQLVMANRERDLAVAHDRQAYPTAGAYETVCEALKQAKQQIAELQAHAVNDAQLIDDMRRDVFAARTEVTTRLFRAEERAVEYGRRRTE